jgi:hypothetical protein
LKEYIYSAMHDLIYRNKGTWITGKDIIRSRDRKEKGRKGKHVYVMHLNSWNEVMKGPSSRRWTKKDRLQIFTIRERKKESWKNDGDIRWESEIHISHFLYIKILKKEKDILALAKWDRNSIESTLTDLLVVQLICHAMQPQRKREREREREASNTEEPGPSQNLTYEYDHMINYFILSLSLSLSLFFFLSPMWVCDCRLELCISRKHPQLP